MQAPDYLKNLRAAVREKISDIHIDPLRGTCVSAAPEAEIGQTISITR